MEEKDIIIEQLNPTSFEFQDYVPSDEALIASSDLDTAFSQSTDYIESYIYDENNTLLNSTIPLLSYNIKEGDVLISPESGLTNQGYNQGVYNILYTFYRKRLSSDSGFKYFIKEISSDRTEIKLDSNLISNGNIISSTNDFITYRENAEYFVDFYLNFGNNQTVIANNIKLDTTVAGDPTILIKLYESLPEQFNLKTELWVVEQVSTPQLYRVTFPIPTIEINDFTYISGPNFNLDVKGQTAKSGQLFSYNTLINSDVTSSTQQIKNLLNEKQININVNYEDYNNFIHFSSAKTRLENFYYKVGLIESSSNQLNSYLSQITSDTSLTVAFSSSVGILTSQIDNIINNFDGYEYFLYFNSGSSYSWPKSNTEPPFQLYSTGSTEVLNWLGSATPGSPYYGGQALSASNYDQDNSDWLYFAIPEYLREDEENRRYELFIDMVGQHYDNIWLYTKDVTNKFSADNRLEYGISKDLVADAIRDFGVKLYSNNFNTDDLYAAFLGLNPSGNSFPFSDITDSLPASTGFEYVDTKISSSNNIIPLDDVNKRLYKRIYHNIPYLLKTKGTIGGLRALITSYGIPDTVLRINEFGGKDRNEAQDWDLEQRVFNYAFDTGEDSDNFITSSFNPSDNFKPNTSKAFSPSTVQFRFKSAPIPLGSNNQPSPDIRGNQFLWLSDDNDNTFSSPSTAVVLEYIGSGFTTGSYSGSIASPYDTWGTLKFYPDLSYNPTVTCSVFAPFFNEDWWSVQFTFTGSGFTGGTGSLFAANEIDGKVGFSGSETKLALDSRSWERSDFATLNYLANRTINSTIYQPFSGAFQEYRMFTPTTIISENKFFDYTLNPYSNEGNTINSTPDKLMFRAALGTQLDTGSRTSIHPRVTGSTSQITQSFDDDTSAFYISGSHFITNVEKIYQDQVPAGIKNRVTDKIDVKFNILPEKPTGSNQNIDVLSAYRGIQQESFVSQSYTPDVNYLEVAISPQNQINDDINAQIGYFNLGDYIGDPRQFSSSARNYPDLDILRDAYFEKYIKSYDVLDFVRLMKFFDNSLFKMIKDFTPARTSLASGVVVKQHILERNRQRPAQVSFSNVTYTGSVKSKARNYDTGSGDTGQYEYNGGSSIYRFSGGTGGGFERYNGLETSPSASAYGLTNRFNLTQSWNEYAEGSVANAINNSGSFQGRGTILLYNQDEFYDGIFSGSRIIATDQSLNPGCDPYKKPSYKGIDFNFLFFNSAAIPQFDGTVDANSFIDKNNVPLSGDAWIYSEYKSTSNGINSQAWVKYIKLAAVDADGNFVRSYFQGMESLKIQFAEGIKEYFITNITENTNHVLITIDFLEFDADFTGSVDGGSENWSLSTQGNYVKIGIGSIDSHASFNQVLPTETQALKYFNGTTNDAQSAFNVGATYNATDPNWQTLAGEYGVYSPARTSNIPWIISGSIFYSASLSFGETTSSGIYHSGSTYDGRLNQIGSPPNYHTRQQFQIFDGTGYDNVQKTTFRPTPSIVEIESGVFDNTINPLIPGNSGSDVTGTPGAGHSRITLPGTASMDFYFPYLQFSGSRYPLPISPVPYPQPISGSDFGVNNDVIVTVSYAMSGSVSASFGAVQDLNGNPYYSLPLGSLGSIPTINAVGVNTRDFASYYHVKTSYEPGGGTYNYLPSSPVSWFPNIKFEISCSIDANITASIQWAKAANPTANTTWYIAGNPFLTATPTGDGVIIGDGGMGLGFGDVNFNLTSTGLAFRVVAWGEDNLVTYKLNNWQVLGEGSGALVRNGFTTFHPYAYGIGTTDQGLLEATQNAKENTWHIGDLLEQEWHKADFQVHLKRTGSSGEFTITSSNILESQSIGPGLSMEFPDSPILNILNPTESPSSSINEVGDMYFIEYSASNPQFSINTPQISPNGFITFTGDYRPFSLNLGYGNGTNNTNNNITFQQFSSTSDTGSAIFISQSYQVNDTQSQATASVSLYRSDNSNELGARETLLTNIFISASDQTGRTNFAARFGSSEGGYPFRWDDKLKFVTEVSKSLDINFAFTEYSMSIFPGQSRWSPITLPSAYGNYRVPNPETSIVSTFFGVGILPFYLSLDCQPTLNNYIDTRPSTYLMDVDYNNVTGSITPVNFAQIISGSATKATVPDSNYTIARSTIPRYGGSKSTSKIYNIWSATDTGTYGKLSTIDLKKTYFSYFNEIEDPYPNINDKIKLNIQYLVDEDGNALPPALEGTSRTIFERVYPKQSFGRMSVNTSDKKLKELNSPFEISNIGSYYSPIIYTQTSSRYYSTTIPLSGSGRISRYDNDDSNSFSSFAFSAIGTASVASIQTREFSYRIAPSEDIKIKSYAQGTVYDDPTNGVIDYSGSYALLGEDLKNYQRLSLETQFTTTYIYDTSGTRGEMSVFLKMVSGSINLPFIVTDVKLSVLKSDQKVYDLGSVVGQSWLNFIGIGLQPNRDSKVSEIIKGNQPTFIPAKAQNFQLKQDNSMQMTLDWEMYNFLRDKGQYVDGGDVQYRNPNLLSLIWTIEAESYPTIFKEADQIHWEMSGSAKRASSAEHPDAAFFSNAHIGPHTPTKITSLGALDHLLDGDNTGSAPFWVFTGSAGGGTDILDQSILVMSSSNVNEAYGVNYYQGQLPYSPGPSEYFPGGQEPADTSFDPIVYPLTFKVGDEIRFANNENYTYTIQEVFKPSQNIEAGGIGRIKILLGSPVPGDVNKDFFLIRRNVPNANSVYLNGLFPYGNLPSGSVIGGATTTPGILYPDFPTEYLENSASILVNELISKGIITS
jgi:hypothetical protein